MVQSNTHIRRAEQSDLEAILELTLRTTRASYSDVLGTAAVEAFIGTGAIHEFIEGTIGQAWVVIGEDQVIGHGVATGSHIDQVMIDERFHRRGLGTLFLARIEEDLFRDHVDLELDSFRDNDSAIAFYLKHGWHKAEAFRDEENDVEMIKMRKART